MERRKFIKKLCATVAVGAVVPVISVGISRSVIELTKSQQVLYNILYHKLDVAIYKARKSLSYGTVGN